MLRMETINLYDHFGLEKLPERAGNLTCIYFSTGWEISTSRVRPAVLIMPGGGYHAVSDREAEPIALRFANRGYAAFVLRYSVKPNVFPTSLRECAMAMKYIRENCEKFEVDPNMVAAIGFSAGGHLCGTLGTMYDAPEIADIAPTEIVRPTAIGLCYPVAVSWGDTHADSFSELYCHTGCQFQPFNTIYQLYDEKVNGRLDGVTDMLMMPEYLMWKLCGVKAREYTNATTMGMVNAQTGEFDLEIVDALGYPRHLFPKLSQPGTVLGMLRSEIAAAVGGNCKVVLCATHDTGSAVEGIPMEGNHPYISSGTWSLLGVKTPKPITDAGSEKANYSNEGGVGYNRYQKNIMGMWLVNELQRELCPKMSFPEIVKLAEASDCEMLVNANSPEFLAPKSMKAAFDKTTGNHLKSVGDYFRCAYRSLAVSYKEALEELEANTGCSYEKLYIVGGGAKNAFLNRLTEEATGKKVIALPIEATALGNLKIQMEVN